MKVRPIVALVSEDVFEILQPVVDEIVRQIDAARDERPNNGAAIAMRLNGWTPEMIAWGQVLRAASEVELEVVTT